MGSPNEQRYSIAQYARRVGISEGRARAMFNDAGGSRLAKPDGTDPDGKPVWYARTIDAWCSAVGRPLPEDAQWPHGWPHATGPAPVVFRGDVTVMHHDRPVPVPAIVWDTERGHVIYLMRYDTEYLDERAAARAALEVLNPVFWTDAVILLPDRQMFGLEFEYRSVTAYQLRVPTRTVAPDRTLPRVLKAMLGGPEETTEPLHPGEVTVERVSTPYARFVAKVIGRPLPLWLDHTCTPEAVQRMELLGDGITFTVPDTTTSWPAVRARLQAAVDGDMPNRYPQAFAVLARDAMRTFVDIQRQHAEMTERGEGWYLAARPARPDWPVPLEHLVTREAQRDIDPNAAAEELPRLRAEEADELWGEPYGEALYEAARMVGGMLYRSHPDLVFSEPVREDVNADGPVAQQYFKTLTRLPDAETAALLRGPTRRVVRLCILEQNVEALRKYGLVEKLPETIAALYRDPAGRLVAEYRREHEREERSLFVEWPTGMPDEWTDATVIAADERETGGGAPVFALTSTADGGLRVEPLPNPGGEPGYSWGYGGGGPTTLYEALIRCALRDWTASSGDTRWLFYLDRSHTGKISRSELWSFIYEHEGNIRLPWPQVQQWAQQDLQTVMARMSASD